MTPFVWLCVVSVWSGVWAGDYLLPGDVSPSHYDLRLAYDVDAAHQFPFYGLVKIDLTALKPTSQIVLHAQDFDINNEKVTLEGTNPPTVKNVNLNDTYNFLTVSLSDDLRERENYTLVIPFSGNLKRGLDGAYVSQYVDSKTGNKQHLVTTQFEAISARKGFPCFDEPLYKASFSINIAHHQDFTAISNMPLATSTHDNSMEDYWPWEVMNKKFNAEKSSFVWDQFEKSVPMSTYLIAFVVSKFSFVESPANLSKAKFRIWARDDAVNQTSYASEIGPKILSYYEEWFNVSFPLPKQDMIAIPDFAAGAMENWGLITYRETALLYDEEQSTLGDKERVAEVVAHELAHQWFGNLVTMKWWSDLWLNEGFATYVATLGSHAVEPNWNTKEMEAADGARIVLSKDSLASSHPVSVELDDPNRISEIFDAISYTKGAALIRMMNMFLGEDVFRQAINKYLIKYSYKNAEQDDLWAELTAASKEHKALSRDVTVKEIMDTWTKQTGYPLLTVTRDYNSQSLTITQKRYLALGSTSETSSAWWVPLNVLCESDANIRKSEPTKWLSDKEGTLSEYRYEHTSKPDEWVLFNADMIAPYRVNYDERNWQLLSATLNSAKYERIPTLNRVQLLTDALELAWSGRLNYTDALQMVNYLQEETNFLPLEAGLIGLGKIDNALTRSPEYGVYMKFMRKIITPAYERSGGLYSKAIKDGDDLLKVKMQVMTSRRACHARVAGCEENAIEMFQSWMDSDTPDEDNPIPLALRSTVYCVALRRGSVAHWRFLLARMKATNVAAAKVKILSALACTNEVWILNEYLEWAVTENSEVRPQDAATVVVSMLRSDVGYFPAKEFVYNRVGDLYKTFNGQGRRLGGILNVLLDQFTTQKELDEFLIWREANAKYLSESKLAIEQAIEGAKVNIGWIEKNKKYVVEQLRKLTK